MAMKCPVCGGKMEKQYGFSGDLYQNNDFHYICRTCAYAGVSDADIIAEIVKKCQEEKEATL